MTAITADKGPREKSSRNGGKLVLKLWARAGAVAAAAFIFGVLYFFVRQYFKDGIWRFDLSLVNKSLGTTDEKDRETLSYLSPYREFKGQEKLK
jgi:hypothetical protein